MNKTETATQVAKDTINMVNSFGPDMKAYAQVVLDSHKTLQQSWMRLACYVIEQIANQPEWYIDGRNEQTYELAKKIVKVEGFGCLPMI